MNLFENYNSREIRALEKLADELTDSLRVIAYGLQDSEIPSYISSRQLSFEKRFARYIPPSDLILGQFLLDLGPRMEDEEFKYEFLDSDEFRNCRLTRIALAYVQFRGLEITGPKENPDYDSVRSEAEDILFDHLECWE